MGTIFNPADINTFATLSNGNLTVTGNNATSNGGVRGTTQYSAGKVVLGFKNITITDSLDYIGVGLITDTLGLANGSQDQAIMCGIPGNAWAKFSGGFIGNTGPITGETQFGANSSVDIALDLTNNSFWFRYNGGAWFGTNNTTADPATNTAGAGLSPGSRGVALYPYVRVTNSGTITLNPTPTSLPSGFSAWDVIPPFRRSSGLIIT
jgi:hypothetical protein